jgi:hypothetical protein
MVVPWGINGDGMDVEYIRELAGGDHVLGRCTVHGARRTVHGSRFTVHDE